MAESTGTSTTKINSYLTFKLGEEEFAAHVGKVLNILEMTKITDVPRAPEYMKGVINLRGSVLIVVMDIDLEGESVHVGALVDSVQAVIEIDDDKILPPPSLGTRYRSEFIVGVANVNDTFIMLLNMDEVFSTDEIVDLHERTVESTMDGTAPTAE